MLRVYLIRHGETSFNEAGIDIGQPPDVPLNDVGIMQSKRLADKLKAIRFDKVFSSTCDRAIQTSQIVFGDSINLVRDNRLREHDIGDINQSSDLWTDEYKRILSTGVPKYDIRPFGHENIWDLINRVGSFIDEMRDETGTVAIVAHAGVNEVFINLSQKREKDRFVKIEQDNACVNVLEYAEGRWSVITINDSSHISDMAPKISPYDNQNKIREDVKDEILSRFGRLFDKVVIFGDIVTGNFGVYDRRYRNNNGSIIEIAARFNEDTELPKDWKVLEYNGVITRYYIGHIFINNVKHRIKFVELSRMSTVDSIQFEEIK